MKFQLGAMSVGDILDRGLRILLRRLGTFYVLNLVLLWPILLVSLAIPLVPPLFLLVFSLGILVLSVILGQVTAGATITVIANDYIDEPVSTGAAIRAAFARLGPLVGTAILSGLIIGLGMVLLIIPGIIFALMYALVGQVVMLEGKSTGAALSRSQELTAGFRGRIFGIMLLVGLLMGILNFGVVLALATAFPPGGPVQTPAGFVMQPYNFGNFAINQVASFLVEVLTGAYASVCLTLVYFDLRVRKEGYDLEVAARKSLLRDSAQVGAHFASSEAPSPTSDYQSEKDTHGMQQERE